MRETPSGSFTSTISAMRRVASRASGWSGKRAAIWAVDFSQKSVDSNFIRPGVSRLLPVPTHSSTSCASAWAWCT